MFLYYGDKAVQRKVREVSVFEAETPYLKGEKISMTSLVYVLIVYIVFCFLSKHEEVALNVWA